MHLDTIGIDRKLAIVFPGRPRRIAPIVMADGPKRSRHRFTWARPSSLCMWFAGDPESMRWTLKLGLGTLIDLTRVHLIKEAWWRATENWPGYEKHHQPPRGNEQRALSAKPSPIDSLRVQRQRCWCGRGRYLRCHGAIDPEDELRQLGLASDDDSQARENDNQVAA